jgi:hypothetical protein
MPSRAPMRGNNAAALTDGGDTPYIRVGRRTRADRRAERAMTERHRDLLWKAVGCDEEIYFSTVHLIHMLAIYAKHRREGTEMPYHKEWHDRDLRNADPKVLQAIARLQIALDQEDEANRDRLLES